MWRKNRLVICATKGGGKVSFTDCHIHYLDLRNTLRPPIHAKAGHLQVIGCVLHRLQLPPRHLMW